MLGLNWIYYSWYRALDLIVLTSSLDYYLSPIILCSKNFLLFLYSSGMANFASQTLCSSVQFSHSVMSNSLWAHGLQHARLPCPSPTPGPCSNSSIEWMMPSNHLILCRPLLLLPSVFPTIRVFSKESVLHIRWQKYWPFSFSISPSSEFSGLISFRMEWFDVQLMLITMWNWKQLMLQELRKLFMKAKRILKVMGMNR